MLGLLGARLRAVVCIQCLGTRIRRSASSCSDHYLRRDSPHADQRLDSLTNWNTIAETISGTSGSCCPIPLSRCSSVFLKRSQIFEIQAVLAAIQATSSRVSAPSGCYLLISPMRRLLDLSAPAASRASGLQSLLCAPSGLSCLRSSEYGNCHCLIQCRCWSCRLLQRPSASWLAGSSPAIPSTERAKGHSCLRLAASLS